jgi:hypothetical protein
MLCVWIVAIVSVPFSPSIQWSQNRSLTVQSNSLQSCHLYLDQNKQRERSTLVRSSLLAKGNRNHPTCSLPPSGPSIVPCRSLLQITSCPVTHSLRPPLPCDIKIFKNTKFHPHPPVAAAPWLILGRHPPSSGCRVSVPSVQVPDSVCA